MQLRNDNPALKDKRTIFVGMVRRPSAMRQLIKSAKNNKKLGNGRADIRKGKWRGMPLHTLTLQERKTCPPTCDRWRDCFGNGMKFAHRADHSASNFEPTLARELAELSERYPRGFVVRLHVLGDFYSVQYVDFWRRALTAFPALHIFGYTHRKADTAIGAAIRALRADESLGERFAVRASDSHSEDFSANHTTLDAIASSRGIICPEQTGKTKSCLTCGLCWALPSTPILFIDHDELNRANRAA